MPWDVADGVVLLDKMCSTGEKSDGMLKTIKKICKKSHEKVRQILDRIWYQMTKPSVERKIIDKAH